MMMAAANLSVAPAPSKTSRNPNGHSPGIEGAQVQLEVEVLPVARKTFTSSGRNGLYGPSSLIALSSRSCHEPLTQLPLCNM